MIPSAWDVSSGPETSERTSRWPKVSLWDVPCHSADRTLVLWPAVTSSFVAYRGGLPGRRSTVVIGGVGSSLVAASGTPSIDRWVIAGGGGSIAVGGTSLYGTVGQPVVGGDQSDSVQLWHGFLGGGVGLGKRHAIYLPVVLRDLPRWSENR